MSIVIGLTGSIGMGKSTVAAMLRRCGVPVWDADAEVRRLQGPGGALLGPIEALFPGTTGPAGLDRGALGRAVFGDAGALRRLEALVHPAVAMSRARFVRRHRSRPLIVLDIPLLFETQRRARGRSPSRRQARGFDAVLVVSAAGWQQRARVLRRPGMTEARFAAIRRLQVPDPEKRRRADIVIPTGGAPAETRAALRSALACLATRRGR